MNLGAALSAFAVGWGLTATPAAAAAPDGRALYHGLVPFRPGVAPLPAPFNACARCHGGSGEGGREGGLEAPALTWEALTKSREDLPPFSDKGAVLRAIQAGEGRGGRLLASAMPRFALDAEEAAALLAYLHRIGAPDDLPPGVGRESIEFGTLLPLSGPAGATGRAVAAGLTDVLDAANRTGGVFGRHMNLRAVDTADGAETAARNLCAQPVFAVVGGLWARRGAVDAFLADCHVGVVAPLASRDAPEPNGHNNVELLPTREAQERTLAAAVQDCSGGTRWSLRLAEAGLPDPSSGIRWFDDPEQLRRSLHAANGDGCLGLDLATAPRLRADVPPTWQVRVALPVPSMLLGRAEPWRWLGRAAGQLAIELLSRSGAHLHERSLIEAAARLDGFAPQGMPAVHARAGQFEGWDAEVVDMPNSGQATPGTMGQQGD